MKTARTRRPTSPSVASTLTAGSPLSGGTLWLSTAEEKALGLLAGNNPAIDGYVGVSNVNPNSNYSETYGWNDLNGDHKFQIGEQTGTPVISVLLPRKLIPGPLVKLVRFGR